MSLNSPLTHTIHFENAQFGMVLKYLPYYSVECDNKTKWVYFSKQKFRFNAQPIMLNVLCTLARTMFRKIEIFPRLSIGTKWNFSTVFVYSKHFEWNIIGLFLFLWCFTVISTILTIDRVHEFNIFFLCFVNSQHTHTHTSISITFNTCFKMAYDSAKLRSVYQNMEMNEMMR